MSETKQGWLEAELTSALGQAQAPAGLWTRIGAAPKPSRSFHAIRFVWPALAILVLFAAANLLWEFSKAQGGLRHIAHPGPEDIAALAAAPDQCDFYSNDPSRIHEWVKSRTNIDIELPDHSSVVRIVGARVLDFRGTPIATVAYESGSRTGTMLVWKNGNGNSQTAKHVFAISKPEHSGLVSWSHGENNFAVTSTGSSAGREACLLCHPEGSHGL